MHMEKDPNPLESKNLFEPLTISPELSVRVIAELEASRKKRFPDMEADRLQKYAQNALKGLLEFANVPPFRVSAEIRSESQKREFVRSLCKTSELSKDTADAITDELLAQK